MDREQALLRRHMLAAYVFVMDHREKVLDLLAKTDGDEAAVEAALSEAFGFDKVQILGVLTLQLRRFTPEQVARARAELVEVERQLEDPPRR